MQNILIINGHEYHEIAKDSYNAALCETMEGNTVVEVCFKGKNICFP